MIIAIIVLGYLPDSQRYLTFQYLNTYFVERAALYKGKVIQKATMCPNLLVFAGHGFRFFNKCGVLSDTWGNF